MAFGFLPHKILPVQTINIGDDIVKFARWDITKAAASVSRAHAVCFLGDVDCQLLARELSEKTDEILAAIATKADEAAVPSPLSFIQLPRAWLSLNADAHACTDTRKPCGRCFCAQLARFAIAQCRSWLVAKITLKVSIVPQVAASLVEALPGEKRKTTHKDGKGDAKKLRISSQVCIPESGGTHPAGAHSFARVRSHCTRAQPRTHTLAC
jgi:hypothetical protein